MDYLKLYILVPWLILIGLSPSIGQKITSQEIAFQVDEKMGDNYMLFPTGKYGAVALLKSDKLQKGEKEVFITFLDTGLVQQWQFVHKIKPGTILVDHYREGTNFYLLFNVKDAEYEILKVELVKGLISAFTYEGIKSYFVTHFEVAGDIAFMGGMIRNYPAIIGYNFLTRRQVVFSSINQLKAEIVDIETDSEHQVMNVVLFRDFPTRERGLYINRYNFDGKLLSNFRYRPDFDFSFLTYRSVILEEDEILFFGTYALKGRSRAQGFYAMKILGEQTAFLKKYEFANMDNFFEYLEGNRKERVMDRVDRRKNVGKPSKERYELFVHDLREQQGQFILTAESYTPLSDRGRRSTFRSGSRSYNGYGNRTDPSMQRYVRSIGSFDDYSPTALPYERFNPNKPFPSEFGYVHTIACGFDRQGELLWDNCMRFDEQVKTEYPLLLSQVYPSPDSLMFVQIHQKEREPEKLWFKVSEYEQYTDSAKVQSLDFGEKQFMDYFENGGLLFWFDNHFLASGLREVKTRFSQEGNEEVFFIRKISCWPNRDPLPKEDMTE